MELVLVIILILLLFGGIGSFPAWDHSRDWGYGPFGGIGLILLILVIVLIARRM